MSATAPVACSMLDLQAYAAARSGLPVDLNAGFDSALHRGDFEWRTAVGREPILCSPPSEACFYQISGLFARKSFIYNP